MGLAVSRFSAHPREALELVRYLTRKTCGEAVPACFRSHHSTELYNLPEYLNRIPVLTF